MTSKPPGISDLADSRKDLPEDLPEDWYRRSFAQKLAYGAFLMREHGQRPSASHREWLYALVKDEQKSQMILEAASAFRKTGLLATIDADAEAIINDSNWDAAISETALKYHTYERWADYGCQVFQLSESLVAMLALTDATVGYADIEWPFPAFMLEIPAGYISGPSEFRCSPVRVLIHDHLRAQGHGPDVEYPEERWLRIEAFFGGILAPRCTMNKCASELVDEIRPELLRTFSVVTDSDDLYCEIRESSDPDTQQTMDAILNFCCGFALWLKSTGGTKERSANQTSKKHPPKRHWPTTWIVGRQVKLDRALRDAAKEAAHTPRTQKGWKLKGQQLISGHWKAQAHGPGHSLRKLIHVEPYLRGPESDEAWSRVYKAGDDDGR